MKYLILIIFLFSCGADSTSNDSEDVFVKVVSKNLQVKVYDGTTIQNQFYSLYNDTSIFQIEKETLFYIGTNHNIIEIYVNNKRERLITNHLDYYYQSFIIDRNGVINENN